MGCCSNYSPLTTAILVCALVLDIGSIALAILALIRDLNWNSWVKNDMRNLNGTEDLSSIGSRRLLHHSSLEGTFIIFMALVVVGTILVYLYRTYSRSISALLTCFFTGILLFFVPSVELIAVASTDSSYLRHVDLEGFAPKLGMLRICHTETDDKVKNDLRELDRDLASDLDDHDMCQMYLVKTLAAVLAALGIFLVLLLACRGACKSHFEDDEDDDYDTEAGGSSEEDSVWSSSLGRSVSDSSGMSSQSRSRPQTSRSEGSMRSKNTNVKNPSTPGSRKTKTPRGETPRETQSEEVVPVAAPPPAAPKKRTKRGRKKKKRARRVMKRSSSPMFYDPWGITPQDSVAPSTPTDSTPSLR